MAHRYHVGAAALMCVLVGMVVLLPPGALSSAPPYQTCSNVILNGGFETTGNWALGPGPLPPAYVSSPVQSGSFAMQTGSPAATTQAAYSWVYQNIKIPSNATSADLTFWVWLQSGSSAGADKQQALLMVPGSTNLNAPYQVLWSTQQNAPVWQRVPLSLLNQKGLTLDLYFNTYNDGQGGSTAMVVDSVSLTICQPAVATPSPIPSVTPFPTPSPLASATASAFPSTTPFPTPSPLASVTPGATAVSTPLATPTNCSELIQNGSFEWDGDWTLGWDPLLPFYNTNAAFVHSGARSMAQGAVNQSPVTTPAYSSIRQDVTLPAGATSASITFWYYPFSNAAPDDFNRQELILLNPLDYDETIEVLWRTTENGQQWVQSQPIDLSKYLGQTLTIYFNARNAGDGTWTGMYLDDVSLLVCGLAVAPIVPIAPTAVNLGAELAADGNQPAPVVPSPGETVISVAPTPSTTGDAVTAPTATNRDTNSETRRDKKPLFAGSPSPISILIIAGVLALLAVLGVVFWNSRRESRKSSSAQPPTDDSGPL